MAIVSGFGCYTRPPMPDCTIGKTVIPVANDSQLTNALNTVGNDPNTDYAIELANGNYTDPEINGWSGSGEVCITAANPQGATFVPGGADAFRIWNVNRPVSMIGVNVDGQGSAVWSMVVGGSFSGDNKMGPVFDFLFSHGEIMNAQQEPVRIAGSSQRITFEHFDVHTSGLGSQQDFGELIYVGQGGDQTDQPRFITLRGFYAYNGRFGEAVDIKVATRDVLIEDFWIDDITARFGGAITLGVDDSNGGHNALTNYIVRRGHISNVSPSPNAFTQNIEAIEVGTDATIQNVTIDGIQGRGVNAVRQFAGPGKTVELEQVTIVNTTGATIEQNTEAPNGGNNPGNINVCNVLTDDGAMGSTQYQSGFVGSGQAGLDLQLTPGSPHTTGGAPCGVATDRCGAPFNGAIGAFSAEEPPPVPPNPTVTQGDCTARGVIDANGGQFIELNGNQYFSMNGQPATPVQPVT